MSLGQNHLNVWRTAKSTRLIPVKCARERWGAASARNEMSSRGEDEHGDPDVSLSPSSSQVALITVKTWSAPIRRKITPLMRLLPAELLVESAGILSVKRLWVCILIHIIFRDLTDGPAHPPILSVCATRGFPGGAGHRTCLLKDISLFCADVFGGFDGGSFWVYQYNAILYKQNLMFTSLPKTCRAVGPQKRVYYITWPF